MRHIIPNLKDEAEQREHRRRLVGAALVGAAVVERARIDKRGERAAVGDELEEDEHLEEQSNN